MLTRIALVLVILSIPAAQAANEIDHWNMTHIDYELDYEIRFYNCVFRRVGELPSTEDDHLIACNFEARTYGEPEMFMAGEIRSREGLDNLIDFYESRVRRYRQISMPSFMITPGTTIDDLMP